MSDKKLPKIIKNTSVANTLSRSNQFIVVTNKVLQRARAAKEVVTTVDDSWIDSLYAWASQLECLGYLIIADDSQLGGNYHGVHHGDPYELGLLYKFPIWEHKDNLESYKIEDEYLYKILSKHSDDQEGEWSCSVEFGSNDASDEYSMFEATVDHFLWGIPEDRLGLKNCTRLNLTGCNSLNKIFYLPSELRNLINLKVLNLSDNELTELPNGIFNLINLTFLGLGQNRIPSLPPEIGKLKNLTVLDLGDNRLTSLPHEIGQLKNIKTLVLHGNPLIDIPDAIFDLPNLDKESIIEINYIKATIDAEENGWIDRLYKWADKNHIHELDWLEDEKSTPGLPRNRRRLLTLTQLNLSNSNLTELSPEIGQLINLTELNLDNNNLTELPPEIGQLKNLTKLYLSSNQLTELPSTIGLLTFLTELSLDVNNLSKLPSEIGQLTNLSDLWLDLNNLRKLPSEIGKLANLTNLIICCNALTELPIQIGQLTNLTKLDISSNELTKLPVEIGKLTNLTELDISENNLTELPIEIKQLIEKIYG